ncbi:phage tail protein [Rothia nasimurium]|uniref:phage tail protein n=1 Tax=Rothia nasimurium TaxID=85336 RepID=UPI001F28F238|nr:hypothetical protein [Rothia nasimurium]
MAKSAILSVRILGDSRGAVVAMKKTSAAVAGLQRAAASIQGVTAGIFTSTTRLSFMATVFTSLAAVALSSVGSILSLGGALASIVPVALLLPGAMGAIALAGGVLVAALKDAGTYLGDLAPLFSSLQDSISVSFWERAAEPIRGMVTTLIPAVEGGLANIASQLAGWAVAISSVLSSSEGLNAITTTIENTGTALDIMGDGVGSLVNGLLGLVAVGSTYLPSFAGWFNEISWAFENWVQVSTANGDMWRWINTGLTNLGLLWDSIVSITGIFAGLTRAANEAGGTGLAGFAGGLEAINAAVNGAAFQGALVQVFSAANEAVGLLGPGMTALGNAFITLAPTIAAILPLASGAFGAILEGVAAVLSHPAVAGGLISAFEGINTGITAIAGVFETLAPLLGAALDLFGGLASGVLPLLATIISTIAPPIATVVQAVADWVGANPELAATLLAITGVVATLVPPILSLVGFIGTLVGVWGTVSAAVSAAGAVFGGIATIFSMLGIPILSVVGPILAVGAGIATLVAGFIYALATSESFRDALGGLFDSLVSFVQPIIEAVLPALQSLGDSFMGLFHTVMEALTPLLTAVVEFASAAVTFLTPVGEFIAGVLGPVFSWLADTVSFAFEWIGNVISSAIAVITSIFEVFTAALRGDWDGMWTAIGDLVVNGLALIKDVFIGGLQFIGEFVFTTTMRIVELFGNLLTSVIDIVGQLIDRIVSFFTQGMVDLGEAVLRGIDNVIQFFRDLPARISEATSAFGERMKSIGDNIIQGLVSGIKGAAGKAVQAVKDTVGDAIDGAKKLLGIKSPSRVFRSIGRFTSEGLAIGVQQMAPKAVRAVETMATRLTAAGAGIQLATPDVRYRTPTVEPSRARAQASTPGTGTAAPSITINLNGVIGDRLGIAAEIENLLREKNIIMGGA